MTAREHFGEGAPGWPREGVRARNRFGGAARLAASLALLGLLAACGNPPEDPGAKRQPEQKKELRDRAARALADR